MGEYLFGHKYSVFELFVLITISYLLGLGALTLVQAFAISMATALASALLTNIFARNS